jgi:hypothetical protein
LKALRHCSVNQFEIIANKFINSSPHQYLVEVLEVGESDEALFFEGKEIFESFSFIIMPQYKEKDLHDLLSDLQQGESP